MRRIVLLITICCQVFWVAAQKKAPKWMDKQRKAVVTVTTYGKDNQKKASGTGFFITETGEALSGYYIPHPCGNPRNPDPASRDLFVKHFILMITGDFNLCFL